MCNFKELTPSDIRVFIGDKSHGISFLSSICYIFLPMDMPMTLAWKEFTFHLVKNALREYKVRATSIHNHHTGSVNKGSRTASSTAESVVNCGYSKQWLRNRESLVTPALPGKCCCGQ